MYRLAMLSATLPSAYPSLQETQKRTSMRVSLPVRCFSYITGRQLILSVGTITLQNLKGPGVGCPNVSTTFSVSLFCHINKSRFMS